MALQIVVSKRATKNLDKIITYIHSEFGENVTIKITRKIFSCIELIAEFPDVGTVEFKEKGIRGFLIKKQLRLFYRVEKNKLIVLNFFDTRQSDKKKLK